ncbi:MAG: hypothetical protein HYY16_15710 [Planctomycetes bacterium]|nr:hypothetical protein [Planctomycetota bacterium]
MTELPIQRLLLRVISTIESLNLPYMIMGGFAVRTWGIPRPTYDADLAVAAGGEALVTLLGSLEQAGFNVPEEQQKGFRDVVSGMRKVKVTRFEDRNVWEVDLFLIENKFLESALGRRRSFTLEGRPVQVMALEDVVLLKLVAHRRKDQLDVEEMLKIARAPDVDYMRKWAAYLGVSERLESALSERPTA